MSELRDRYPGLRPFKMEDADLFFGRDHEIKELTNLIASERTTVVFGASGVGKSSLLNTAFLKSTDLDVYYPIRIRFSAFSEGGAKKEEDGPLQIVSKQLAEQLPATKNGPIVYNKDNPKLWEHIKRAELLTVRDYSKKLLLIFDQFEEFFYFDHKDQKSFNHLLAEIVHEQTPTRILEWVTALNYKERTPEILEWYTQPDIKLIFSIRSDKLSAMNHMVRYMPQILKNRMELRPFSISNARGTINEPAQLPNPKDNIRFNSPPIIINEKVVTRITNDLKNAYEEIEGAFLQIVCYSIENQVKELTKDLPDRLITPFKYGEDLFDKQIDIATILDKFYQEQISKFSEENAGIVKKIIEDDLVNYGERTSLNKYTLEKKLGSRDYLIRDLLDARLIREENTARGLTYELSHDKLIAPVEKSKARRLQEEEEKKALDLVRQQEKEFERAQNLRKEAEDAKLIAEDAQIRAEKNAHEASILRLVAEKERKKAEDLRKEAENAKLIAGDAQIRARKNEEQANLLKLVAEKEGKKAKKFKNILIILSILSFSVGIAFILINVRLKNQSEDYKDMALKYRADGLFSYASNEFDNFNYYTAFNLLYESDSIKHSGNSDSMFQVISSRLFMGQSIKRNDDGSIILTKTKDSILQIWNNTPLGYKLQADFGSVAYFVPAAEYNKLLIRQGNLLKIFDLIGNRELGVIEDARDNRMGFGNLGGNIIISDEGNLMIYQDTSKKKKLRIIQLKDSLSEIKGRLVESLNNYLDKTKNMEDGTLYELYGISKYITLSFDGNKIFIRTVSGRDALYCFDLKGTEWTLPFPFTIMDKNIYFRNKDSLVTIDSRDNKRKRVALLDKKIWSEISKTYFSIHPPFIYWGRYDGEFRLYNYHKSMFISQLAIKDNWMYPKFDSLGVLWLDSSNNLKYCGTNSNDPVTLTNNSFHVAYSDFGFVKNQPQFYIVRKDTISIRNLDGSNSQDIRVQDIASVLVLDSHIVHAICKPKGGSTHELIISRNKLEKIKLRKLIPYLTPELNGRFGIRQ